MDRRQPGEPAFGKLGQAQHDAAAVLKVVGATAEAGLDQPVDQLDRAVMADAEPLGELADGRAGLSCKPLGRKPLGRKPLDCQQCLMLARGQPGVAGRGLAEFEKPADQIAEIGQGPIARAVERRLRAASGQARIGDAASPSTCVQ